MRSSTISTRPRKEDNSIMNQLITTSLLGLVALETSYLAWRSWRSVSSYSRFDHPIFVDTSVLMDGRIVGVAGTGFITGELVIPRSVILELQLLADKADHEKRERARFGLDVVSKLQAIPNVRVRLFHDERAKQGVDERLLELARKSNGLVLTLDYNLQKVGSAEGIQILNINELAQQLRLERLPGEKLSLALVEKGSDSHQAIGYLEDGTMVVVEHASSQIGKTKTVEIIRSLQTAAGRMAFAKIVETESQHQLQPQQNRKAVQTVKKPAAGRKRPLQQQQHADQTEHSGQSERVTQSNKPQQRPKKQSNVQKKPQADVSSSSRQPSTERSRQPSSRPKTSKQREASLLRAIDDMPE